jgi:hypothetical protein
MELEVILFLISIVSGVPWVTGIILSWLLSRLPEDEKK